MCKNIVQKIVYKIVKNILCKDIKDRPCEKTYVDSIKIQMIEHAKICRVELLKIQISVWTNWFNVYC